MFQGQPKRPKYAVGDTVYLVNSGEDSKNAPAARKTGIAGIPAHQIRAQTQTTPARDVEEPSSNISPSTTYKVKAIQLSDTDEQPHRYELIPIEPFKITATEANIIPALFLPGDIVTPIASAAVSEDYYRVKAVTIKEDAALLTSRLDSWAIPKARARDDGEYEMLENPFAGGFYATREREVAGRNFGGAERTSLSKAGLEERTRVVLSLVDGCGIEEKMDAKKVRKVPADEEWKFVQLEKFMGQK